MFATVSWTTEKACIKRQITDKGGYFSDQLVDRIDLVLAGLDDIFAIFFIFGMSLTIFGDDGLYLLDDVFGLIDGMLETGVLGLDLDADLNVVFRLLDSVLDIKYNACPFFLLSLLGLDCESGRNG